MVKRVIAPVLVLMVMVSFFMSGCTGGGTKEVDTIPYVNNEEAGTDTSQPQTVQDEVLFFVENQDKPGFGDLYLKRNTTPEEKLASDVQKDGYGYLYSSKKAIYLDIENNLYIKPDGAERKKLASNAYPGSVILSEDESTIAFLSTESPEVSSEFPADLYILKFGEEREKISSNMALGDYKLSYDGRTIYFKTNDRNLYVKKKAEDDKAKIASNIVTFVCSGKGNAVIYQNDTDGIYIKSDNAEDAEKIYSGMAGKIQAAYNGKTFCYLADYNTSAETSKGELYMAKPGMEPLKVGSDIDEYILSPDGRYIYYRNTDKALYLVDIPELKSVTEKGIAEFKEAMKVQGKLKLGDDITIFATSKDGSIVAWTNTDFDLYYKEPDTEKVKLAPDVESFSVSDRSIIYRNKDNELYVMTKSGDKAKFDSSTKVRAASDLEGYAASPYCRYITYATTAGELYYLTIGSDPVKLTDKLDDFDLTSFQNHPIYEKKLQVKDIEGTWERKENDALVEIKGNEIAVIGEGISETVKFTVVRKDKNTMEIDIGTPEGSSVELVDKDTLVFRYGEGMEETYIRITKEAFDAEVAKYEQAAKAEEDLKKRMEAADEKGRLLMAAGEYLIKSGIELYDNAFDTYEKMDTKMEYTVKIIEYAVSELNGGLWCKGDWGPSYDNFTAWFIIRE